MHARQIVLKFENLFPDFFHFCRNTPSENS
jgi:hypothetical protein